MNTGTYSSAKEKSDEMAAILRDISLLIGQERDVSVNLETGGAVVCGLGFMSNAHSLSVRAQDIQQGIFKIIVLGEFKHGKSTLLNSMLGGRVLAARATPCTAIVTMLVYGDSNNVSVYKNGNEIPQVMSLDAFNTEYQLTKEDQEKLNEQGFTYRFQDIDYAQIACQHSLCANGVRLIDSPGLKESNSRTKITTRFLRQAQAIIFVLNATQIISEDERQFIKENLGKGRLTNIFFVINKINLVDEFEVDDIKKYVKLGLEECFTDEATGEFDQNLYDRRVFYVDAKSALAARSVNPINQRQLEESGVLRLELELESFLASDEKVSAYFESSIQSLSWIIPEVQRTVRERKQVLDSPLAELEQKSIEVEQRLIGLESRRLIIDRTLQRDISKIGGKATDSFKELVAEMRNSWKEDSQKLDLKAIFDLFDLKSDWLINTEAWNNLGGLIWESGFESITQGVSSVFLQVFTNQNPESSPKKEKTGSNSAKQRIIQIIEDAIKKYLDDKFVKWSNKLPSLLEPDIQEMLEEAKLQTEAFEMELNMIRDFFFGVNSEVKTELDSKLGKNDPSKIWQAYMGLLMYDFSQITGTFLGDGNWWSFILRAILQGVTIFFVGNVIAPVLGGIVAAIAFAIFELILVILQKDGFKAKILETIGNNLFIELDKLSPKICQSLEKEISNKLTRMIEPLLSSLQNEIDQLRQVRDKILSEKRDMNFSVDKEKSRLNAIETKVNQLFARVCEITYGKQLTRQEMQKLTEGKTLISQ